MVAAGDSTPSGEDSGVSVAVVVTRASGKGLGTFGMCGLLEASCAVPVGDALPVGVGMGVSKPPEIQTNPKHYRIYNRHRIKSVTFIAFCCGKRANPKMSFYYIFVHFVHLSLTMASQRH